MAHVWQHCDGLLAVRLNKRLCYRDVHGRDHAQAMEPIHILQGDLPTDDDEAAAWVAQIAVERVMNSAVACYRQLDEVAAVWWEDKEETP